MLPSINTIQTTTAGRSGRLGFTPQGNVTVASRMSSLLGGVRRILERVGILRHNPVRARKQNEALMGFIGRIEARFNPHDLKAANINLAQWKAKPETIHAANVSRSLGAVSQAEAQRIADRRTAASQWLNFAPQVDSARVSSPLFERMPEGFDSWPADRRARFQPTYRRTFEAFLEYAIRNESPDRRINEAALANIADRAIAVATKASESPQAYEHFQAAWERHNDAAQRYVEGMLNGESAETMQNLQRDFAKAQLAVNASLFPGSDVEQKIPFTEIRQVTSVMAVRHIKSHLLDTEPKFAEKFAASMENAKPWAVPLISTSLMLDISSDNRASEIVQKAGGAHCVLNLLGGLLSDSEIGSDLPAPHWMGDFLAGGSVSDFDARTVQWEIGAKDEDIEPIAERDEQMIESLYEGDLEAYFSDTSPDDRAARLGRETQI